MARAQRAAFAWQRRVTNNIIHFPLSLELVSVATTLVPCCTQINTAKKRTGVIAPKKFINQLKRDNELFRSYMHQVGCRLCLGC